MKYDFRFVGASTTRRLAESFVSIYTGKASRHVKVHESQDFSVDKLKVKLGRAAGKVVSSSHVPSAFASKKEGQGFRFMCPGSGLDEVFGRVLLVPWT